MSFSESQRRLPSAEWTAIVVAGIGLLLAGLLSVAWMGLAVLAVLVPPLLRELGWLHDGDEYLQQAARRAGLHAAVGVALVLILGQLLLRGPLSETVLLSRSRAVLALARDLAAVVFLLSYLLQYWGARGGVARLLLGLAAYVWLVGAGGIVRWQGWPWLLALAAISGLMVLLSILVRRWPRAVGAVLLLLLLALVGLLLDALRDMPTDRWLLLPPMVTAAIVFGGSGLGLLRADAEETDLSPVGSSR